MYLEGVLVLQVQGVTRELRATAAVALDQIAVLVACLGYLESAGIRYEILADRGECEVSFFTPRLSAVVRRGHTGDLPDEVAGNVRSFGGHCE